jgi:hypothetical protein
VIVDIRSPANFVLGISAAIGYNTNRTRAVEPLSSNRSLTRLKLPAGPHTLMKTLERTIAPTDAWSNRFETPSRDELLASLSKPLKLAAEHAARSLSARGLDDRVRWLGVWRWCLNFERGGASRPAAYLIPDPRQPRLCIPLSPDSPMLVAKRLPAWIRQGASAAPVVEGIRWAVWSLETRAQIDELLAATLPA